MIKILSADLDDCDAIIKLQKLAYQSEAKLYNDWSLPPLMQTLGSLHHEFETSIILKAIFNTKIIGSVRAQLIDGICHIGRLIVHPDFQGRGIGSNLLSEIEQRFTQVFAYELFTGSKSEFNIRFYQRQGYKISHTKNISDHLALVYLTKTTAI